MLSKILKIFVLGGCLFLASVANASEKECFEKVSRGIFKFNQGFDNLILEPLAKGYNKLPEPVRNGTGNFTSNVATLLSIPNHILQGEFKMAGHATGSFLINTTVGVLGLGNPASAMGLKNQKEDIGQTLGIYGVGGGCYFVLPVLGPTTVRDSIGSLANISGGDAWYNVTVANDTRYFNEADYYLSRIMSGVDFRAKNLESFDSLEKTSIDLYASIRSLYLQDRTRKINNLDEVTETMSDDDWEEID